MAHPNFGTHGTADLGHAFLEWMEGLNEKEKDGFYGLVIEKVLVCLDSRPDSGLDITNMARALGWEIKSMWIEFLYGFDTRTGGGSVEDAIGAVNDRMQDDGAADWRRDDFSDFDADERRMQSMLLWLVQWLDALLEDMCHQRGAASDAVKASFGCECIVTFERYWSYRAEQQQLAEQTEREEAEREEAERRQRQLQRQPQRQPQRQQPQRQPQRQRPSQRQPQRPLTSIPE
jgi:hypothetical protein